MIDHYNFPPVPTHEEIAREQELRPIQLLRRIEQLEKLAAIQQNQIEGLLDIIKNNIL